MSFSAPDSGPRIGSSLGFGSSPRSPTSSSPSSLLNDDKSLEDVLRDANNDKMDTAYSKMKDMSNILLTASDSDRTVLLFELRQVLEFCRDFVLDSVLPIICQHSPVWSESVQLPAAEAISIMFNSPVPFPIAKMVSSTATNVLKVATEPMNFRMWGEVLCQTLPYGVLAVRDLEKIVGDLELRRGRDRVPVAGQVTARILGAMAMHSKDKRAAQTIMHRAIEMSNEDDFEVRGMIAESLTRVAGAIDVADVEEHLWPCIVKLSSDDNARVRAVTFRTMSAVCSEVRKKHPKAKLFSGLLPPFLYRECAFIRKAAAEDQRMTGEERFVVLEEVSLAMGNLLFSCHEFLDEVMRKEMYKAFLAMATCNAPVIRKNCAFNFPAVCASLHSKFRVHLSVLTEYISRDLDIATRFSLAAGLHETVRNLADRDTLGNLMKAIQGLLTDEAAIVRLKVVEHFEDVLAVLVTRVSYNSGKLDPLFDNLQLLSVGDWRAQQLVAEHLGLAAHHVPPSSLINNVIPLLYKIGHEGTNLARREAMLTVAKCMRCIPDVLERDRMMREFKRKWAHGPIYWMRIAFIESAQAAAKQCSRCLFRDLYGLDVLKLANDSISNVRLKLVKVLPELAPACNQMEEFHTALDILKNDKNEDVRYEARNVDESVTKSLEEGKTKFEDDMKLEDEERDLSSRHIHAHREALRKKGNIKKATTVFFGKGTKGGGGNASGKSTLELETGALMSMADGKPPLKAPPNKTNVTSIKKSASSLEMETLSQPEVAPVLLVQENESSSTGGMEGLEKNRSFKFSHFISPKSVIQTGRKNSRGKATMK